MVTTKEERGEFVGHQRRVGNAEKWKTCILNGEQIGTVAAYFTFELKTTDTSSQREKTLSRLYL